MPRLLLLLVASSLLLGQSPTPVPIEIPATPTMPGLFHPDPLPSTDATRILQEIAVHQQAVTNLAYLCDMIGPRLTGSDALRRAQAWALLQFKHEGAENVHEEPYTFGPSWTRGTDSARLLTQNRQPLHIAALGWTPSTQGLVHGSLRVIHVDTPEQLLALKNTLPGHLVLADEKTAFTLQAAIGRDLLAPPLAILISSEKQDDHMTMAGSPKEGEGLTHVPTAIIANEHADLLERLAARDEKVEMEVQIGGRTGPQPVQAYNVVAEIRGSQWPEQVVIVGAHQDSWDLATGATDNGTGTVAAMEVIRALKALGLRPKRTIRCVLFSGEEQGLLGSFAYTQTHAADLKNIQAVLIDDLGTGTIKGWTLQGFEACAPTLAAAMAPANVIGCRELLNGGIPSASDNWPFEMAGVPAFFAYQDFADYFTATHHSQLDTWNHVKPDQLIQGAQAMAVTAWGLANTPERLPHLPPKADTPGE